MLVQAASSTNKYDMWIALGTAFFAMVGGIAAIVGPILANRRAKEVKAELKTVTDTNNSQLEALGQVKTIVNGNNERLQRENAALVAEVERLRNAKS
jgi:hypothetical protein